MLHMVVMTHGPETCAVVIPAFREKQRFASDHINEVARRLRSNVLGIWVDSPAHTTYMLIDAPNTHDINRMVMELRLMDWNTVIINPVLPLNEMNDLLKEMKI